MIYISEYFSDVDKLLFKIRESKTTYDCIVCLKRSGFIIGSIFSNQLNIPLFVPSEIKSIPDKYKKILVVDDKICTGKSMSKVVNKLIINNKKVSTAVLYIEKDIYTHYYVSVLNKSTKMFYEII